MEEDLFFYLFSRGEFMKTSFLIIAFFSSLTLSFLFFSSCDKHESLITTSSPAALHKDSLAGGSLCDVSSLSELQNEIYSSILGEENIDTIFTPEAYDCVYIQHVVVTHRYEPKAGKTLGIWPFEGSSQSDWNNYRVKWGFKHIRISDSDGFQFAINAGYTNSEILLQLPHDNTQYQNTVNSINVQYYYIDEPIALERIG